MSIFSYYASLYFWTPYLWSERVRIIPEASSDQFFMQILNSKYFLDFFLNLVHH